MRFLYKFVNSPSKGGDEKQLFHQFFCMITITNTMTNTESRDFVFIFSGKSLISNLIIVNCSEFTKLIIKFHLLLATQISGWRARCLMLSVWSVPAQPTSLIFWIWMVEVVKWLKPHPGLKTKKKVQWNLCRFYQAQGPGPAI